MDILIWGYTLINFIVLCYYYREDYGVFQFPFLISCVSLTFVLPQLIGIYINDISYRGEMVYPMVIFTTCNIGLFWGYKCGISRSTHRMFILNYSGIITRLLVFFIIGSIAYYLNRGVYKGGFISGIYVIINFFTQYLGYALIIVFLIIEKNYYRSTAAKIIVFSCLLIIVVINIDRIILLARRAEAIQFILIISYFFFQKSPKQYKRFKIVIPLFFIIGMALGGEIGKYRENSYSGKSTPIDYLNNIEIDVTNSFIGSSKGEIKNAMLGINHVSQTSSYDYGAFNWNNIIGNYIPKSIVGNEFKQSILIETEENDLVAWLTRSGSTMTGYYDAYKSFGILAFFKFFIEGYILGLFWNKMKHSEFYILPYLGCITAALHILTHSSGNFVSAIIFWGIFVFPFISKKSKYEVVY